MNETQKTICEWASSVFGYSVDLPRWYARLMEEIGELGEAILDEDPEQIAKEAADSVIMLIRIIGATGYDLPALINKKMAVNRAAEWNLKNGVGHRKSRGMGDGAAATTTPPRHFHAETEPTVEPNTKES